MSPEDKFDLPQGTLDLLIMRVVALGPIHGYAIAQRIQQMSRESLASPTGIALSRASSPRIQEAASRQLAAVRDWPRSKVL